mmetsp:Transcript_6302/g.16324  ORF Transcript_6302/g.16324 Transcript_6302/m.16324 type:complete len:199 (-) Transcript_6302:56-652(-)
MHTMRANARARNVRTVACGRCLRGGGTHRNLTAFSSKPRQRQQAQGRRRHGVEAKQEEADARVEVTETNVVANEDDKPGVEAAVATLKFYKRVISPLLPASCRFVPTCSAYATASYRTYGVAKGTVLTAWRLARCNPFAGSGYDPPSWPPPGLLATPRAFDATERVMPLSEVCSAYAVVALTPWLVTEVVLFARDILM